MDAIKKRTNSIDIFRYFCAVLVVVLHTELFLLEESTAVGVFLSYFVARIAVPFFFVVSGYFFFTKAFINKASLRSVWKLIKVYAFWSVPYFFITIYVRINAGVSLIMIVKRMLLEFFVIGSYYHFWFFPVLIYSTLIVYAIYKRCGFKTLVVVSVLLYLVSCAGTSYSQAFAEIPLLSSFFNTDYFTTISRFCTGIPFIVLGGLVAKARGRIAFNNNATEILWLVVAVLAYVAEKCLLILIKWPIHHPNTIMLFPLVAVVVMILLNHPLEGKEKIAQKSRVCANFIYYVHPAFLLISERVVSAVLHIRLSSAMNFILTVIVLTIMGLIFNKISFLRKLLS